MQEEFKQTLTEALTPVDEVAEKASIEPANDAVVEEEAEAIVEEAEEKEEVVVEEEPVEEEEEVEVEEEPQKAEKGESKAEPVHDNIAEKTETINIYKIMGRNADGTRRH